MQDSDFTLPGSFDEFDFSFPLGAYGNSSGWSSSHDFSLNREPDLAPRRITTLVKTGESIFIPLVDGYLTTPKTTQESELFPFVQKVPNTPSNRRKGMTALSSGGGSAIVRQSGKSYKIKRCGLADKGFIDEPYKSHLSVIQNGEHIEMVQQVLGGLMRLPDVLIECRMAQKMADSGLVTAYKPAGIIIVTSLPDGQHDEEQLGAVVIEVNSDLRLDELAHMALSPLLTDLFSSNQLYYDPRVGCFEACGIPVAGTLKRWTSIFERLEALGRAAGAAYRRVHDDGYLRGVGSCWFGNEVVDEAGEISLVDFDGGACEAVFYESELSERLQRVEINQYCSESYIYLSDMRPKILACFAATFVDAVRRGYEEEFRPIPVDVLRGIINDHLAVFPILQKHLGFSQDIF